jgi:acyl carrier protein
MGAVIENVAERIGLILKYELGLSDEQIKLSARIVDDLGADSLDQVEIVMHAEEEFEIEISDEDAEKITTVQQAIDYVVRRLSSGP